MLLHVTFLTENEPTIAVKHDPASKHEVSRIACDVPTYSQWQFCDLDTFLILPKGC